MTDSESKLSPVEEGPTSNSTVNPYQSAIHTISAEVEHDAFAQKWKRTTAWVGTLSRAVTWGLILFLSLNYVPNALQNLASKTPAPSRVTLAAIAWLELMAARQWALWAALLAMLGVDFAIRIHDSRDRKWRRWLWNIVTVWIAIPLWLTFFVILVSRLV